MMSLEVAAEAAVPPEVVTLAAAFPEAMVPAAVSPEVVAHAAEPPEAAVRAYESLPCFEPAMEAIYALPVFCVSISPRSQSLLRPEGRLLRQLRTGELLLRLLCR